MAVALAMLSACGSPDAEPFGASAAPITGPRSPGTLPESTLVLTISQHRLVGRCHATLLQAESPLLPEAPPSQYLLTAAHCFGSSQDPLEQFNPPDAESNAITISVSDARGHGTTMRLTDASPLIFHPQSRRGYPGTGWTAAFPFESTTCAHDLVLVRLPEPIEGVVPARVYHFACFPGLHGCTDDLSDVAGCFGGWDGEALDTTATGEYPAGKLHLVARAPGCDSGDGPSIAAAGPTLAAPGDSGGGLFVDAPTRSIAYASDLCDRVPVASQGAPALVGVAHSMRDDGSATIFTPVYLASFSTRLDSHANETPNDVWLHDVFTAGGDGDGICDGADNCKSTANSDQANANALAESAWGVPPTARLGDACDPAPTPAVTLSGAAGRFIALQDTRAVADQLAVRPVSMPGAPPVESGAQGCSACAAAPTGRPSMTQPSARSRPGTARSSPSTPRAARSGSPRSRRTRRTTPPPCRQELPPGISSRRAARCPARRARTATSGTSSP
ncbi:MAG: hypothetical protein OZ921_17765 [Sorangiineae bacterium]|nr:hypothetical protein [Polyangiaceae bacterium]MEB2324366.1 hypothetical protein [Sorangiineae bacterium]